MMGPGFHVENLTNTAQKQAAFLTLITFITLFSTFTHADPVPAIVTASEASASAKEHMGEVTRYLRKQGLQTLSALPDEAKTVMHWFSGTWRPTDDTTDDESTTNLPPSLIETPTTPDTKLFGVEVNYHHKGFLPTRDAVVMGMKFQKNIMNDKIGFSARPFYGQSWHSFQSYYGAEITMDIAKRDDDGLPWGKISLNYVGGNDRLTDNGRGVELRGDVDLTHGFKFTTGARTGSTDNNNFAMLRWSLKFGGNP